MSTLARLTVAAVILGGLAAGGFAMQRQAEREAAQLVEAQRQERLDTEAAALQERTSRLTAEVEASSRRSQDASARTDERRRSADMEMAVQLGVERALADDRAARKQGH